MYSKLKVKSGLQVVLVSLGAAIMLSQVFTTEANIGIFWVGLLACFAGIAWAFERRFDA